MEELLKNKNQSEKANIKAIEIVKVDFVGKQISSDGSIVAEIQSIEKIDGGIQIFARAWKDGQQLGFGVNGTVDIERFRIFNPPILVDDKNGTIIQNLKDGTERRLREDPKQAVLNVLAHTIDVSGKTGAKIVVGSVGNTTDTFFAGAGDGMVQNNTTSAGWSTIRSASTGTVFDYTSTTNGTAGENYTGAGTTLEILRHFYPFDTSSLPDGDTISSATFTVFTQSWTGTAENVGIVQTTQASNTQLATTDFNKCGALNTPTEGASRQTPSSVDTTANDFALNASGISWISKTGYTLLGMRNAPHDIDNVDPGTTRHYFTSYDSEQTGTSLDPKLVVVHAPPPASNFLAFM